MPTLGPATGPDFCTHEWSRLLSDPGTPRCIVCLAPFDPDIHAPAVPDSDPPIPAEIRSYSDWAIECREAA